LDERLDHGERRFNVDGAAVAADGAQRIEQARR
jgi:hypothetical protein